MAEWDLGDYTLANADSYHASRNNPSNSIWLSFDEEQREAALREAERKVWVFRQGKELTPVADYAGDERIRHDYATYEQALDELAFSQDIANGELSGAKWIADSSSVKAEDAREVRSFLAPKAKLWLGISVRNPIICRG